MKTEDMDNIIATSEWKGYWESLINENVALRSRVARLEEALKEIDANDTYSAKSYGPFAAIARRALEEK